jgi:hypothetical protein
MTPLPALPLVPDASGRPHLIIDNSTIEKLRCPRLLEYEWLRRRVLVANKAGRNFGSTLHVGWAVRYQLRGNAAVDSGTVIAQNLAMATWLDANPQPTGDFRNLDHACRVMEAYNKTYGIEDFSILKNAEGKPCVESSFLFPLGEVDGLLIDYCGKIDLGIERDGGLFSFDHKTTFQFGKTWERQLQMDGGQLGYCWAIGKLLGRQPAGYIIDGVRIRKPKRSDEYSDIAPIDASDFVRMPVMVYADDLDSWQANTLALVRVILTHHRNGIFPMHRWNCTNKFGECDMIEVCSCPESNRAEILASTAFEDNTWSPLEKPENKGKTE